MATGAGEHSAGVNPPDLSVELGPLRLRNPVMNASGTLGYGHESPDLTHAAALGAIVTKTLTHAPRAGNPPPRLCETPAGLLNSIGLQNVGVESFLSDHLPRLCALGPALIVSVGGSAPAEYARCIERLEDAEVAAYEVNISCPNVASGGLEFGRSESGAAEVVRKVRRKTRRPLFVKLSPNVTDIVSIGRICVEEGADGLTGVNTFTGMVVNVEQARPVLPRAVGGVSGPAIRALAVARVWELARGLSCPIIGVGGIVTARDAMEFMLVGAGAVQVGSANLRDPARGSNVVAGLEAIMRRDGVARIRDVIGTLRR